MAEIDTSEDDHAVAMREAHEVVERNPPPLWAPQHEIDWLVAELARVKLQRAKQIDAEIEMGNRLVDLADARGIGHAADMSDEDIRTLAMEAETSDPPSQVNPKWGDNAATIRDFLETQRATRAVYDQLVDAHVPVPPSDRIDHMVRRTKQHMREQHSEEGRRKKLREQTNWNEWFMRDYDAASKAWDDAHAEG